ncbi:hypothetical protein [Alteromonas sp. a30]|uniref:hypothetical protein n=1 Tax=Alteromonas sp. a30 TaxID=2730917 RepID=UPI00227EA4DD|nr:hypothetical protein [Alteromonas sp. a30]MCY7296532.1 hypothetical protein [Alteromonas sp. a30]
MSDFDKKLNEQLAQLPDSIEPSKDLWVGIEHSLLRTQQNNLEKDIKDNQVLKSRWSLSHVAKTQPLWAMAAAVAFVAVIGWFGVKPEQAQPDLVNLAEVLASQHEQQKQALLVSYQEVKPVTNDWQAQLKELDDAAEAIKMALKNDPNNKALLQMLQQVYQQQLSLIETVYNPKWRVV